MNEINIIADKMMDLPFISLTGGIATDIYDRDKVFPACEHFKTKNPCKEKYINVLPNSAETGIHFAKIIGEKIDYAGRRILRRPVVNHIFWINLSRIDNDRDTILTECIKILKDKNIVSVDYSDPYRQYGEFSRKNENNGLQYMFFTIRCEYDAFATKCPTTIVLNNNKC